jgi:hypothetical protein
LSMTLPLDFWDIFWFLFACMYMVRVVAIDVGLQNLALAECEVTDYNEVELLWAGLDDITDFQCSGTGCLLPHEPIEADWVAHLHRRHAERFARADVVLVERQPPQGFRGVEQLLVFLERSKARLVQPRTLHAAFGVGGMSYELRKEALVRETRRRFAAQPLALEALEVARNHDLADAMMMAVWYSMSKMFHPDRRRKRQRGDGAAAAQRPYQCKK